jgi:hypothetical protein
VIDDEGTLLTMLWAPIEPATSRAIMLNLGQTTRARDLMLGALQVNTPAIVSCTP